MAFLAAFRAHTFDHILSRDDGIVMVECPRNEVYHIPRTYDRARLGLGTFVVVDTEDRDLEAGTLSICRLLLSF